MIQCAYCAIACQAIGAWLAWHAWQMCGCILACRADKNPCTLIIACACLRVFHVQMMTCSRAVGIRPYALMDAFEQ